MTAARCKCSHILSGHRKRSNGKWLCASAACGCIEPRPDNRGVSDHDDRYSPDLPVVRHDFGAGRCDELPDRSELL